MATQTLSFSVQQGAVLRFLGPLDIPEVKQLCSAWFPIDYPDSWYEDITSNPKFYSLCATYDSRIIGMVVCEVKPRTRCNKEDADILASYFPPHTQVAYILSLGVLKEYRRNGIASLLLDNLIAYLTSADHYNCKTLYLHVLTTNVAAINFYERRQFKLHNFLPYYYSIKGMPRDGYCYVLYINGGQPPWSILDYMKHFSEVVMSTTPCDLPKRFIRATQHLWSSLVNSCAKGIQGMSR